MNSKLPRSVLFLSFGIYDFFFFTTAAAWIFLRLLTFGQVLSMFVSLPFLLVLIITTTIPTLLYVTANRNLALYTSGKSSVENISKQLKTYQTSAIIFPILFSILVPIVLSHLAGITNAGNTILGATLV